MLIFIVISDVLELSDYLLTLHKYARCGLATERLFKDTAEATGTATKSGKICGDHIINLYTLCSLQGMNNQVNAAARYN